ncbi:MAG: 16S rRNA (cytosine(1402)-N(4))-methyltransferase RsmH [Pseudomonadota bacterium]
MAEQHVPVLLGEALAALTVVTGGCYVDATFGRGGHSRALLEGLGDDGRLIALDRDPDAIDAGRRRFNGDARVELVHASFEQLDEVLAARGVYGAVDGLLMDIGVSSPQIDTPERGFSFMADGPLDMRMDPTRGPSAADWLAAADERDMSRVFKQFGEERHARRIAAAIVGARDDAPITRTGQLAQLITDSVPRSKERIHPATRVFQALRIQINDELGQLARALPKAVDALAVGGRLAVIAFHSLEDRIVKRFFRDGSRIDPVYSGLPNIPDAAQPRLEIAVRRARAGADECAQNPRARSATLRAVRRVR